MAKQNYPKGRNRNDRGGRKEHVERNCGWSPRSTAEKFANYWLLAILPEFFVTLFLWHSHSFFMQQDPLPEPVAIFAGIATAFVLNSLLTVWFYKTDKRQAEQQLRRIPEFSLHFWELFCGWPGALYAQRKYRHKWKKTSYMVVFWICVALNVTAVFGAAFPEFSVPLLQNVSEVLKSLSGKQ